MKKILLSIMMVICAVCANAITIDDLCGNYIRHMDNRKASMGGVAPQIADINITISALDDTHVVLSGMLKENLPIMGEVNLEKKTISFNKQVVDRVEASEGEFIDYLLANAWGETADDEPVIATIKDDGTIVMGSEDEAYAGFCFQLPVLPAPMFSMYGIITLVPDKTTKWSADATYTLGNGQYVSGESKLICTDPAVTGYYYSLNLKTYWGKYTIKLKQNEDGSFSIYDEDEQEPGFKNGAYFWWIKWYEYPAWSEWTYLYTKDAEGVSVTNVTGNEKGGTITFKGDYVLYSAETEEELESEELEPTIYEAGQTFTITWGDETSISAPEITEVKSDDAIYNISGQRVTNVAKGIYIKNGKKFYIK